ncbi:MAG: 50S ribosomal protein L22 [Armatimonadetes bacterium]|nr:50S ribosomal protein L22 [Armatimonadota bacterium]
MQALAKARFVRTSPRKARLVIDAIRGKDVKEALGILQFTPNYAARLIEKVLKSAVANAENNHHMDGDNLKVATAMVDGGPMMKRVRYAPMGRGYRMVKRLSHISIGVEETEPKPEKKRKRKGEVARTVKPGARVAKTAPKAAAPAETAEAKPKATRAKKEAPAKAKGAVKEVVAPTKEVVEQLVEEGAVPVAEVVAEAVETGEQTEGEK